MRTPIASLVLSALVASACREAPTGPAALGSEGRQPEHLLGVSVTWKATHLPFYPTAINDAGVIVGFQWVAQSGKYQAVRWENGTLTVLPASSCPGGVRAMSISPAGVIAGFSNGCALVWTTPTATPSALYLTGATLWSTIAAVYDDGSMVGTAVTGTGGAYAFRGSQNGLLGLLQSSSMAAADAAGNAYGISNTHTLIRWYPNGSMTPLPIPTGASGGGYIAAADPRGDVVGRDGSGSIIEWYASGTTGFLTGLPGDPAGLNNAGRLIGTEYVGGLPQVWTSYGSSLTRFSAPDTLGAHAVGVNSCGSIVAQSGEGYTSPTNSGWLYTRSGITPVCDQMSSTTGLMASRIR